MNNEVKVELINKNDGTMDIKIIKIDPVTGEETVEVGPVTEMSSRPEVLEAWNSGKIVLSGQEEKTEETPVADEPTVESVEEPVVEESSEELTVDKIDSDIDGEHEITEEHPLEDEEKKNNLKRKATLKGVAIGAGAVTIIGALLLYGKACGKEKTEETPTNDDSIEQSIDNQTTADVSENDQLDVSGSESIEKSTSDIINKEFGVEINFDDPTKTLDEIYANDRYIEMTEEDLLEVAQAFKNELASKGVVISDKQANQAALAVHTEIFAQKNPDLITKYVDDSEVEAVVGTLYEQISNAATLETIEKENPIDWTIIFKDKGDKTIAESFQKMIEDCKEIARSDESNEEKTKQISELVEGKFCVPMFDHSKGLELADGTKTSVFPTLGAETYIRGYVALVLVSDNEIANYLDLKTREHTIALAEDNEVSNNVLRELRGNCKSMN